MQCLILDKTEHINTIIMDLKWYRSGVIFTFSLDCPIGSIISGRFWIMTTICCKLNQGIMTNWNYSSGCGLFRKVNIYIPTHWSIPSHWSNLAAAATYIPCSQKAAVGLYPPKQKICGVVCFHLVTPGDSGGQRSLVYCSPRGRKESDTTQQLNNGEEGSIPSVYCPGTHQLPVLCLTSQSAGALIIPVIIL